MGSTRRRAKTGSPRFGAIWFTGLPAQSTEPEAITIEPAGARSTVDLPHTPGRPSSACRIRHRAIVVHVEIDGARDLALIEAPVDWCRLLMPDARSSSVS
jgi:hypothetical protein